MEVVTRQQLKKNFKKSKKLKIPDGLENVNFQKLTYYSFVDLSSNVLYTIYNYAGNIKGIRWKITNITHGVLRKGFCDICNRERDASEIILVTAKVKRPPKSVVYMSRGTYICKKYFDCNNDMNGIEGIEKLYSWILD